jgi:hypothetical protein
MALRELLVREGAISHSPDTRSFGLPAPGPGGRAVARDVRFCHLGSCAPLPSVPVTPGHQATMLAMYRGTHCVTPAV